MTEDGIYGALRRTKQSKIIYGTGEIYERQRLPCVELTNVIYADASEQKDQQINGLLTDDRGLACTRFHGHRV